MANVKHLEETPACNIHSINARYYHFYHQTPKNASFSDFSVPNFFNSLLFGIF